MKNRTWRWFLLGILSTLLIIFAPRVNSQSLTSSTEIFFSAGCADCWPYTEEVLIPTLQGNGLATETRIHDYTVPSERKRLLEVADSIDLPRSIADYLYAFVPNDRGNVSDFRSCPP